MLLLFLLKEVIIEFIFGIWDKKDAIGIIKNSDLNKKKDHWPKQMSEISYHQRNRDVTLNRVKDYYKNDKERLRDNARGKYRNLSEEEKKKKREYGRKQISQYVRRKKTKTKEISKKLSRG